MKENKEALFAKSFYLLGDSLNVCYDCAYCRLNGEKCEEQNYHLLPTDINDNFKKLPIAVNLFYGDPLLQIDNTIKLLKRLESIHYEGPVIIITKGDYSLFPDVAFDLDLHIAFSIFGTDSIYDGSSIQRVKNNLKQINLRKNNYKYSLEYRPICYGVNDSSECFKTVFELAKEYNLALGYSGLQGKPSSVEIWKKEGIDLKPYPGYSFGHKKLISKEKIDEFESLAKKYEVPIFRKTSCLISYVHSLGRDYNAHYYRPNEVGCSGCIMQEKCMEYKNSLTVEDKYKSIIPFDYELIKKENHECVLKKQGICNFPTEDCSHINGVLFKVKDNLTTSDVRVIKWLTGITVDANFTESAFISENWSKEKGLILKK